MGIQFQSAVLLLLAFVTVPCCGGGGGGSGKKSGGGGGGVSYNLSGDFHRISFSALNTADISRTGTSTFVAPSSYSESETTNANGTISPATDSGSFSVSANGAFSWMDTGPSTFSGGVLAGGAFAISSSVSAGTYPTTVVDLQKSSGATTATVSGTYFVVGYGWAPGGGTPFNYAYTGTLTADGAGNWSLTATVNANGTINVGSSNSGTYTVAADGQVTWTDIHGVVAIGGVSAAGDIITTSAVTAANAPENLVGIRKSGTFSNASLLGSYRAISIGSGPGVTASHYTLSTNATFDGAGNMSWTATQNLEGTISPITTISETYFITPDGTVSINSPGPGLTFVGGVLNGGAIAVAADITSGGFIEIRIYVRI